MTSATLPGRSLTGSVSGLGDRSQSVRERLIAQDQIERLAQSGQGLRPGGNLLAVVFFQGFQRRGGRAAVAVAGMSQRRIQQIGFEQGRACFGKLAVLQQLRSSLKGFLGRFLDRRRIGDQRSQGLAGNEGVPVIELVRIPP